MSQAPPEQDAPSPAAPTPRRAAWTAVAAWGATVVVITALTALSPLSSLLMENLQVVAAAMFLYLPTWLIERQGADPLTHGLHARDPWRQGAVLAVVAVIVFPLFGLGFHAWQSLVRERSLRADGEVLVRWPRELEDRPTLPTRRPYAIWDERGTLTVTWREADRTTPVDVEVALDAPPESVVSVEVRGSALYTRALGGRGPVARWPSEETAVRVRGTAAGGVRVEAHAARTAEVTLRRGDEVVRGSDIALGRWEVGADDPPLRFERGWWWLVTLVLIQVLVVGLPEEVFYRGLLQTRLGVVLPAHVRLFGAPFGAANVVTSVLFALGHYLVELDPGRLAVFFPSLLFGWIRDRTGSVAAGAVLHGASNVLLTLLSRMYV